MSRNKKFRKHNRSRAPAANATATAATKQDASPPAPAATCAPDSLLLAAPDAVSDDIAALSAEEKALLVSRSVAFEVSDADDDGDSDNDAAGHFDSSEILAVSGDKRKRPSADDQDESSDEKKSSSITTPAKKQRVVPKRQKMNTALFSLTLSEHSASTQADFMRKHFVCYTQDELRLHSLETTNEIIEDASFMEIEGTSSLADDTIYSKLLNKVLKSGAKSETASVSKGELRKNGPLVLIVCGSGIRCMDVIRATRSVGQICIAKLFAKHLKLEDQVKQLSSHPVEVAIGTPDRINRLVSDGSLRTGNLRLVVLDSAFRDKARRSLLTNPETRAPFFDLFRKHVLPLVTPGDSKKTTQPRLFVI